MKIQFKISLPKEFMASEANTDMHWVKRRKWHQNQKIVIVSGFRKANIEYRGWRFPLKVTLIRISPRKLNYDNLVYSFKAYRDGLADELKPGLAPGRADDDEVAIEWEYSQEAGKPKEYGIRVEICDNVINA